MIFIAFNPYSLWHIQIFITISFLLFLGVDKHAAEKKLHTKTFRLYLLLIISIACSALLSINIIDSVPYLFSFLCIFLILLIFPEAKRDAFIKAFIWAISILGCISLVFVISKLIGGNISQLFTILATPQNLIIPYFGHSFYAVFLIILFPFVLEKAIKGNQYLPRLLCVLFGTLILFSFSKGAMIIAVLQLIAYLGFEIKEVFRRLLLITTVGILTLVIVVCLMTIFARNLWLQDKIIKDSTSARLEYWRQGINAVKDSTVPRLLFGYGPGTFYELSNKYQHSPEAWSRSAHNFYLQFFVENGLIASVILIVFFAALFIKSQKSYTLAEKVSLVSTLLFSLIATVSLNFFPALLLFLIVMMGKSLQKGAEKKTSTSQFSSSIFLALCLILTIYWTRYMALYFYFFIFHGSNSKALSVFPYEESFWTYLADKHKNNPAELRKIKVTLQKYSRKP